MNIDSIFEFGRTLGQGRFGVVIYAKDRSTGNEHAVKIISKRSAEGSTRHSRPLLRVKQAEREIMILQSINHPHIVHLQRVYDTREKLYMVMELCNGDLGKVFRDKSFTEDETRHVIQDLASAVSYLHKNDIVHRDLKLENILVAINPNDSSDYLYIKVIDFGLSIVKGGIGHEDMLQEFCGTVVYMAPELIAGKRYSHQCDVWAMGVILYHLLCGSFPFYSSNEVILCDMILKDKPSFSEQAWHETVSQEAAHLTNQMLTKDPAYRITASEVGNHPWVLSKVREPDSSLYNYSSGHRFPSSYQTLIKSFVLTYLLAFKEPAGSLPPSHKPAIGPYPEQD
ncbi:serine/threonine-protein kinase 33-like [Periplaneta americana]|uniref:serine/threonine-protein kinase 33-like n=1 Tax=Periplaneta americana TaxID=6978 RepID=UPI0037E9660B